LTLTGSAEPLRVHHWKWWFNAGINVAAGRLSINSKLLPNFTGCERPGVNGRADVEFFGAGKRSDHHRIESGVLHQLRSDRKCLRIVARQGNRNAVALRNARRLVPVPPKALP
jgi:hypothetical protein